ncbi:Uncharacterized protein TPAR_00064 [Tolypocladium paradoxum]|uniref:Uncharacterized protein n=1 Tax=Tolypocladium paradoxum TaxID=94208 RepID=A0A2S4LBE6_9HYPO|nr:Uncharacterized protein TPAR_00064 [Tolypocladium paradoxum]
MSASKTARIRRQPRHTGFPQPFDECMSVSSTYTSSPVRSFARLSPGRSTTLPHPEADMSPNTTHLPRQQRCRSISEAAQVIFHKQAQDDAQPRHSQPEDGGTPKHSSCILYGNGLATPEAGKPLDIRPATFQGWWRSRVVKEG